MHNINFLVLLRYMLGFILPHKQHLQRVVYLKPLLDLIQQFLIVAVHNNVYLLLYPVE